MQLPSEWELLLKVLASPDDDEPRLVYADVLQERGEVRGEFIPLQCELARLDARANPQRFRSMREREGQLLTEHSTRWLDECVPLHAVGLFTRGFVEELQCLPGELLERGLEVAAPVRVLRLDGETQPDVGQRILGLPLGARVKELTLRLLDGQVDTGLKGTGASLEVVRQLSVETTTVAMLHSMGWLPRLKRLELPFTADSGGLLAALAQYRPEKLEQLWLNKVGDGFETTSIGPLEWLWRRLPKLVIRWRGVDYRAEELSALAEQLVPPRIEAGGPRIAPGAVMHELLPVAQLQRRPLRDVTPAPPMVLAYTDPPDEGPAGEPPPILPVPGPFPPPRTPILEELFFEPRGFLPRAAPQEVTLFRVAQRGVPMLVAIGPAFGYASLPFSGDVARLMSMPRSPRLLRVTESSARLLRDAQTGQLLDEREEERWAVFEPFEGVTLWEFLQHHGRLSPGVVLRIIAEVARATEDAGAWQPCQDDVLLGVRGDVQLLAGFPETLRAEEPSYQPRDALHPLGLSPEDPRAPGAQQFQLATALFELLTGTQLLELSGRGTTVLANDWFQLHRLLNREGLSLERVDPALAPFDPLLKRALSHAHADHFDQLENFATALEAMPQTVDRAQIAQAVTEALLRVPRTRDGRREAEEERR